MFHCGSLKGGHHSFRSLESSRARINGLSPVYKWLTSCLLRPVNSHLEDYDLMEGDQRGAREKCSGTTDNLLIDRMVCQYSQRGRRNISMAWIDDTKRMIQYPTTG